MGKVDYAPAAITDGFQYLVDLDADMDGDGIYKAADRLALGGVRGDAAHYRDGGYHVPAHACPPGDYSTVQAYDKGPGVDPYAASALDITPKFNAALIEINARLIHAVNSNDPRLYPLREFFGPDKTGTRVTGRDVPSGRVVTSDDSHLWHEHLSFKRKYANDAKAIRGVMDIVAGKPITKEFTVDAEDAKLIRQIVKEELDRRATAGVHVNGLLDSAGRRYTLENFLYGLPGYRNVASRVAAKKAGK